jgi:hypothetical protein
VYNGGGVTAEFVAGANELRFNVAAAEQMRLTTTGLGIGATSPAYKLDVIQDANSFTGQRIRNNDVGAAAYAGLIINANGNSWGMRVGSGAANSNALEIVLDALGTPAIKATLDASGNLGLGVTPSAWGSSNKAIQLPSGAVWSLSGQFTVGANVYDASGGAFTYVANGHASRYRQLDSEHAWFTAPSGTAGNAISFTQAMTLDASGNLLVGQTSGSEAVEVTRTGSASTGLALSQTGTSGRKYIIASTGTGYGSAGNLIFYDATAAAERARITSGGSFQIGSSSGIDPRLFVYDNDSTDAAIVARQDGAAPIQIWQGASAVERARITSGGDFQTSSGNSVQVGGTAARATTAGTNRVDIFDGTAPVGTLANGVSFYSASGEANVMDAAGNATLLSPHDAETNEWIFRSKHTPTGKVLKIDVERLLRFVNDHFGLDAVEEFIES